MRCNESEAVKQREHDVKVTDFGKGEEERGHGEKGNPRRPIFNIIAPPWSGQCEESAAIFQKLRKLWRRFMLGRLSFQTSSAITVCFTGGG